MTEFILQSIFIPLAVAVVLLLLPRLPWSVDVGRRITAWTAAPALGAAAILSLYIIEGLDIWMLTQRWYSLWVSALIVAIGGALACRNSSDRDGSCENTSKKTHFWLLFFTAALAILFLQMPNYDGLPVRLSIAMVAGVASLLMIRPARFAPVATPFALCISLGAVAILLIVSGSMKVGLVAFTLSLTSGACAAMAFFGRGFSGGPPYAMAGTTLLIALGLYGISYHDSPGVPITSWSIVSFAPVLLCMIGRTPSRTSIRIAIFGVVIVCATTAIIALQAAQEHASEKI